MILVRVTPELIFFFVIVLRWTVTVGRISTILQALHLILSIIFRLFLCTSTPSELVKSGKLLQLIQRTSSFSCAVRFSFQVLRARIPPAMNGPRKRQVRVSRVCVCVCMKGMIIKELEMFVPVVFVFSVVRMSLLITARSL